MKLTKPRAALAALALLGLVSLPAAAQDIQERTIRFGHLNNTDHPTSTGVKKFAELVAAKSGGKIKVQEFPAASWATNCSSNRRCRAACRKCSWRPPPRWPASSRNSASSTSRSSSATPSRPTRMVDGPLGKMLSAKLAEKGVVVLGFFDLGFRNVTNSKRPITKAEDLDGLKLRVIPNPVFLETFKTFKANPVPMPFAELYGALESKAVDGQENPYSVILSSKFFEVKKYVSGTNHVYATNPDPDQQALLGQAVAGRAEDAAGRRHRSARTTSAWSAARPPARPLAELKAKGMPYQRHRTRRDGPHARRSQAGPRQVRRLLRAGRGQDLPLRAGARAGHVRARTRNRTPGSAMRCRAFFVGAQ